MPPRPVILDTNFLLIPFQFRIDIFKELDYLIDYSHRYVISSRTVKELKKIAEAVGKDGMAARLAIKLLAAGKATIEIVDNDDYVDEWIEEYARHNNAIVATNDSRLRKRLRDLDIKVISMKSKSKLGFV
jgi:hypothetical protein